MKKTLIFLFLFLNLVISTRTEAQFKPSATKELQQWLNLERDSRPALNSQSFANRPLNRKQVTAITALLYQDRKAIIQSAWAKAWQQKTFESGPYTFKFEYKIFGEKPRDGRSLYISLHGGGGTTAAVNDQQWRNQIKLYTPAEGIYVAPRAPTDTWNMWHQAHIDSFITRLVQAAIVFEDVNPNKVYVLGYSAGGDGVFQLAPRLADYWAAAAMMAGHPGDATALNLRNIGFTIHMGGKDAAYKRNELAKKWSVLLDSLARIDTAGYRHWVKIYPDLPHWMNRQDSTAIAWLAKFTRQPLPTKVIWQQDDVLKTQFYWLAVSPTQAKPGRQIVATYQKNEINIHKSDYDTIMVNLNDNMVDFKKPVVVRWQGKEIYKGKIPQSLLPIWESVENRTDNNLVFSARLVLCPDKVIKTTP